jgi:hypothetical protein
MLQQVQLIDGYVIPVSPEFVIYIAFRSKKGSSKPVCEFLRIHVGLVFKVYVTKFVSHIKALAIPT